jgi:CDP-2,3-bis-(O-geranylgeranyl)-sn-glycerol synthase
MIQMILQTLWLFLPALLANLTPPLVKKIDFLGYPVDFGAKFRGQRVFGDHKTFRGLFFGIIVAMAVAYIQMRLYAYPAFQWLSIMDYPYYNVLLLGFLLGFGALFGDMVKSFFKRQVGIKPGKSFVPFDQLDFLIGAVVFLLFVYIPSWKIVTVLLVVGFLLHVVTNLIGYLIGVNKQII